MVKKEKLSEKTLKVENDIGAAIDDLSNAQQESKRDKQALLLLGIFGLLILLVIGGLIYKNSLTHVDYDNIRFAKSQSGKVTFYTTPNIFLITANGDVLDSKTIDFRINPKKLANIPINLSSMKFIVDQTTYVSFDDVRICEDNGIASANLGFFLSNFGIKRAAALANESRALEANLTYATCQTHPDNTVLFITNGNQTMIKQLSENCYVLQSNNCDILNVTERFELAFLEEYVKEINKVKVVLPAEYFK